METATTATRNSGPVVVDILADVEAIAWVARALVADATRPFAETIHIYGNVAYGSDGRRLHSAKLSGFAEVNLPAGDYRIAGKPTKRAVVLAPAPLGNPYPDVTRITREPSGDPVLLDLDGKRETRGMKLGRAMYDLARQKRCVNVDYVADLWGAMWSVTLGKNGHQPLRFESISVDTNGTTTPTGRVAYIMPMVIED